MKKISILLASLFTLGLASCDMEKYPYDSIQIEDYYQKPADFEAARVGIYSTFRGLTTGGFVVAPEIQADGFNAKLGFSNTYGELYRWTFGTSTTAFESVWYGYYSVINNCNLFINNANKCLNEGNASFTEDNRKLLYAYTGEVYFARAYCHFALANLFCKDYEPATAGSEMGLMLQLEYNATPNDHSTYPGRSTLAATYKQIVEDLDSAEVRIATAVAGITDLNKKEFTTAGMQESPYITDDVVAAMQARVALQMHEYETAAEKASSLINARTYPLATTTGRLVTMWAEDSGSEIMWLITMKSKDEAGSATGMIFVGQEEYDKDYIPSADLLDLYDIDNDKRFGAYFAESPLKVSSGAKADIYFFNKYPGNEFFNNLSTETKRVNQSKPFHISEMYLVAAEAYAQAGDLTNATKYLEQLKKARISGYENQSFASVTDFMKELRNERTRELACEGYRLMDLKRWGIGVKRTASQNKDLILYPGDATTEKLDKAADDYRMVWPIPKSEIDSNPQISNQQNPGY